MCGSISGEFSFFPLFLVSAQMYVLHYACMCFRWISGGFDMTYPQMIVLSKSMLTHSIRVTFPVHCWVFWFLAWQRMKESHLFIQESCLPYEMSHCSIVALMKGTRFSFSTYKWVMVQMWMSHGTHVNESRLNKCEWDGVQMWTYKWVMVQMWMRRDSFTRQMWMRHGAHVNESRLSYCRSISGLAALKVWGGPLKWSKAPLHSRFLMFLHEYVYTYINIYIYINYGCACIQMVAHTCIYV